MYEEESKDLTNLFVRIFKKRKRLILLSIIAVLVPVIYLNETSEPVYEASTTLVFEQFEERLASYEYDFSREVFFNNQLEEIQSFSFAQDVYASLSSEIIQKFSIPPSLKDSLKRAQHITSKINKKISAFPVGNTNIISINFESKNPSLSMVLANTAANVLQKRNYEIKKTGVSGVRQFIEKQLENYKNRLDSSETLLKNFKEKNRITSISKEVEEVMHKMTQAEIQYNSTKTEKRAIEERLETLSQKLKNQREEIIPELNEFGSPGINALHEKLVNLNLQYMNLSLEGYPSNHPKMRELKNNIGNIQKNLSEQVNKLAESEKSINPIAQMENYINETNKLQMDLESLSAKEKELRGILNRYSEKLQGLPDKEFMLAKLTRNKDVNHNIYMNLLEKHEEAKISEADQVKTIRVIDKAQLPDKPIKPRKKVNMIIGFLLGALLGTGIAFIFEYNNNPVENSDEIEAITQWPVLYSIPDFNKHRKLKKDYYNKQNNHNNHNNSNGELKISKSLFIENPHSGGAEVFRMLKSNLLFTGIGKNYNTLLVSSIGQGDGKSTIVSNLGIALAKQGKKTLIIDADLRIPTIHTVFDLKIVPGFKEIIDLLQDQEFSKLDIWEQHLVSSKYQVEKTKELVPSVTQTHSTNDANFDFTELENFQQILQSSIKKSHIPNLDVLTSGEKFIDPNELNISEVMPILLNELKHNYEIILIDSAPILLVNESAHIANIVDKVLLIARTNVYNKDLFGSLKRLLDMTNASILGTVLNQIEFSKTNKNYYQYYTKV